ncbi:MAG: PTS sugar transporter subunit IIB [Erysipelotrichaceae bacterium]
MKFLAVCGFGVGSSMILRMSLEKVCKELALDVEVENTDISSAHGEKCDAIFTSAELQAELQTGNIPVYPIKKYMDLTEVKVAVQKFLEERK